MSTEFGEPLLVEPQAPETAAVRDFGLAIGIATGILLATFAAYSSVVRFGFIPIDDPGYVYANPFLRESLNAHSLRWIFLSARPDNWFPLTRLSLFLDYRLFGLRPGWYHAENVVLHAMASLILFSFLRAATGKRWPSAFVALVFALHPLHVESVAWVAERKDVLCAVFWFGTLWAWLQYTKRGGFIRYGFALACFALGLMSKPMIVTLPLLLLLLDLWPLGRIGPGWPLRSKWLTEKIPFFVLSLAVAAVTVAAQSQARAIQTLDSFPLALRLGNALISVAAYTWETVWPARLWVMRAYPRSLPLWETGAAALGIATVWVLVLRQIGRRPWLTTGWSWFLITLLPVIGLIQVGSQGRADRYMYIPMVGLAIMLAFSTDDLTAGRADLRLWTGGLGVVLCIAMGAATWRQTQFWKDFDALFLHAIDMDSEDYLAYGYLASVMAQDQPERILDAIAYSRKAVRVRPEDGDMHANLANSLGRGQQFDAAIAECRTALRLESKTAALHARCGSVLLQANRIAEAIEEYEASLRLDPRLIEALNDLGSTLARTPGREQEGLRYLERAAEVQPDDPDIQSNLAQVLVSLGRPQDAIWHYRNALVIDPDFASAHLGLSDLLGRIPDMEIEASDEREAAGTAQEKSKREAAEMEPQ